MKQINNPRFPIVALKEEIKNKKRSKERK